jgi:pyruvate dehydrogenase E2 component (dihydrolipoamide acetyltransferase)
MSIPILMPALSPTMEEGKLAKWHVKAGDQVKAGDVIAEIETDKATMEVEAVDEGKIGQIVVPEGTEGVKVNAPIAVLLEEGETAADVKAVAKPAPSTPPSAPVAKPAASGQSPASAAAAKEPVMTAQPISSEHGRVFASPLARRLAADKGVDVSALAGSGPHGRVVKRDIETAKPGAAPAIAKAPSAPTAEAPAAPAHSRVPMPPPGSYDEVPLDGMRKVIAKRLTESFRDVPHFPLTIDLEIDKLLALRKELNGKVAEDARISINDMIIRATAIALKKVPDANASYTEKALLKHHNADIAVAVAIPGGLITPIIFKADTKGMSEIAAEMKDKAARARTRHLKPEEYQGGTFSISNLGMMGIKSFASIINEPHGAIMSVGAGEQRPIVKNGALAIAMVMTVTLTCDHRVVDGATGAQFLGEFKKLIEDPMLMLL